MHLIKCIQLLKNRMKEAKLYTLIFIIKSLLNKLEIKINKLMCENVKIPDQNELVLDII